MGFATFKLDVHNPKPFCHKPISYPPKARAWLNEHLAGLTRMGIIRPLNMLSDTMPTFTSSVVLVPQGQSGQDYRMCVNLPDVNRRTRPPVHPL